MVKAFLKLMRPGNCLLASLAALIGLLMAGGLKPLAGGLEPQAALGIFIIVFLITGAGNAVNDYFDREIDAINRPDRPIPSGRVKPVAALRWSLALFAAGCALAWRLNWICFTIAIVNSVLLYFYARNLKATPLAGNLTVAYLTSSTFIFGGATLGLEGAKTMVFPALLSGMVTVSREIEKAVEDMEGDLKGGARTLPIMVGAKPSSYLAAAFTLAALPLSFLIPLGRAYLAVVAVADLLLIFALTRTVEGDATGAQRALKMGMTVALIAFLAGALEKIYFY
jgi:geranylgeranylglycerol-phosphate geranylgeranyltransferase